jgi:hypothetical protein
VHPLFSPHPHIPFRHLCHPPNCGSSHAVGEDGEEGSGALCVVGPALACGAPEFKEVTQADGTHKRQHRRPVAGGADGNQDTRQRSQDGQGLVHRGPHKGQHSNQENQEDKAIESDPQLPRVFRQCDTQEAYNPVNGQVGNGPRWDDPEWVSFECIVGPQVVLDTIHSQFSGCRSGLRLVSGSQLTIFLDKYSWIMKA